MQKTLLRTGLAPLLWLGLAGAAGAQTWTELLPTGPLPPPVGSAAYNTDSNRMVIINATGYTIYANDVWALTNANGLPIPSPPSWVELVPSGASGSPPTRSGQSAVYDPATNRMIVFGGSLPNLNSPQGFLNDVWVLKNADGSTGTPEWIPLNPAGGPPEKRIDPAAVYDRATNRMIVFGGRNGPDPANVLNDVWVLTHANGCDANGCDANAIETPTWIALPTTGPPSPRSNTSAAYDSRNGNNRMILFGGWGSTSLLNDVWVLTHANGCDANGCDANAIEMPTWMPVPTAGAPPLPRYTPVAYDETSNQLIVFGGGTAFFGSCGTPTCAINDTWVLTNANANGMGPAEWRQILPLGTPPPGRMGHDAVYDAATNRLVVFGGQVAANTFAVNDTWLLACPVDSVAPDIMKANPSKIDPPPDGRLVLVTVDVTDNCDPDPSCLITGVTSNQNVIQGVDWIIDGPRTVFLKAASTGKAPRRYEIQINCTDDSGNASARTVNVKVKLK